VNGETITTFVFQFCLLFTACLGIGLQFSSIRNSLQKSFIVGFFILTSILSLIYVIVPKNWELTAGQLFWPLIVLLSILWMKIYRRKYLNLRLKYIFSELGLLIFLLLIIPMYLSYNIRYHSSPDNHGFGITTAYINNHFSYSYLANDFMGATGLDKPIFLGQKTPLLDSTWHILDTQLRFASDMVFTVGRIGFPVLAAVIGSQFQTIDAFSSFVLLLGIISMWCLGFLTLQLIKNLYSAISSIVVNSGDNNGRKTIAPVPEIIKKEWIAQSIIAFSPWLLIYVVEGAITQTYLILAILLQLNLITEYIAFQKSKSKLILLFSPIFISVVYPSGFIFYIGVCGFYSLLLIFLMKKKMNLNLVNSLLRNGQIFLSLLAVLPLTLILTRYTFVDIIKNFLKGANNRPYDLGPVPIFDVLPIFGQRLRTENGQIDGLSFSPILNTATPGLAHLAILTTITLVTSIVLIIKYKKSGIVTSALLALPIILIYLPIRRLINSDQSWFPYFYFRDLTLIASLGIPILLALIMIIFSNKLGFLRYFKTIFITFSLVAVSLSTNNLIKDFRISSTEFNVAKNIKFSELSPNSLFVSDAPDHTFFVMAMYGRFNLLTDGWSPELISNIDGTLFDVLYIKKNDEGKLVYSKIGTFEIQKDMKLSGNISVLDIQKINGFKKI